MRFGCTSSRCRGRRFISGRSSTWGCSTKTTRIIRRRPSASTACCSSIRTIERAQLYLKDIQAAGNMYYDEDAVRHQRELEQVMRIPIGDFELSARSRNCLERAGIETLGDLTADQRARSLVEQEFRRDVAAGNPRDPRSRGACRSASSPRARRLPRRCLRRRPFLLRSRPSSKLPWAISTCPCGPENACRDLGLVTIGELLSKTADELLSVRNFGVTSLNEVRAKLTEMGLRLRND